MHKAALPEPKIPELDPELDGEDDDAGDFGELLRDLDETLAPENDDDQPFDDAANELDPLPDGDAGDGNEPHDLDLGPDSLATDDEASLPGDAVGLEDGTSSSDLMPEDTLPADDEERDGIDDQQSLVNDLELPGLDADDGGGDDFARFGDLVAATEMELEAAALPWQLKRLSPERERCRSLALDGRTVVAGSTDLLWLGVGDTSPVRVGLEGTRILGLALLGEQRETALCVTASGQLVRRSRFASDAERLSALGRHAEVAGQELERVELCQLGRDTPQSVLGRAASGLLFRSDDAGTTLHVVEPRLSLSALSPTGSPIAALTADGAELLLSSDAGATFERAPLDAAARKVAGGEQPGVTSSGRTLVLHDAERGVAVSTDAGHSFREVPGAAAVSAVAVGMLDGRATIWLALYAEINDTTRFVRVDAELGRAEVIATLGSTGDADAELGTSARIERLGWDGSRLFAAGDAGLYLLTPTDGPDAPTPMHH